jgi:hypothetical protein
MDPMLLNFKEGAWRAMMCADSLTAEAGETETGADDLLLGIVDAGQIGARALTASRITREAIEEIVGRHRSPRHQGSPGRDFKHAMIVALRVAGQRAEPADSGDLLLGTLDVFAERPVGDDLAHIGLTTDALEPTVDQERAAEPEAVRPPDHHN